MTQYLTGPQGIEIKLDANEIFPDDPGAGTPAMVSVGKFSATYWCAADTGELDCGEFTLTSQQLAWLQSDKVETIVNAFVENNS